MQKYTNSKYTHVGMIFNEDGEPWLYEATPPRVRKIKLADYYKEVIEWNEKHRKNDPPCEVWIYRPLAPYDKEELAAMKKYLLSQIDRKYSITGYILQEARTGCHCSELMAETLNRSGRMTFQNTYRVSPGDVEKGVSLNYDEPLQVVLNP